MRLGQAPYFLFQAIKNLYHHFWVHAVGVGTMTVALVIFGMFLMLFLNVDSWVKGLGGPRTMSVFLKDDVSEPQRLAVRDFIEGIEGASVTGFISKEDALDEMRMILGDHKALIESLDRNPLPASYEVIFEDRFDPAYYDSVASKLAALDEVDSVQHTEQWVSRIEGFIAMVRMAGVLTGALLGLGVLMIVTNTVKLTVYSRRDEIEILKMVGATDSFVKAPFLLEGMIHGLVAGGISLGLLYTGHLMISPGLDRMLGLAALNFSFIPTGYVIALCAAGVILGFLGSYIALGRFFRS